MPLIARPPFYFCFPLSQQASRSTVRWEASIPSPLVFVLRPVWRRVYMEAESVQVRDVDAALRQKYGDPSYQSKPTSNDLYKWRPAGNDVCLNSHGGQRTSPISMNWRELGGEPAEVLLDGEPMPDSQISMALFEPQ